MTEQLIEKIETMEKKHEKEKHQREKEDPKSYFIGKIYRANRRAGKSPHDHRI